MLKFGSTRFAQCQKRYPADAVLGGVTFVAICVVVAWALPASSSQISATFVVTNELNQARAEEVLELPLAPILVRTRAVTPDKLTVLDPSSGKTLPVQLFDTTNSGGTPNRFLVLVSLGARESRTLRIVMASESQGYKPLVEGGIVPDRFEDFYWENNKIGYRVYGPDLQATGEISSGIDVWLKRIPTLVIPEWYRKDAESQRRKDHAYSYHKDYGQGLDSYRVGRTAGCGGTAVLADNKLWFSNNYAHSRVLANGPIRLSFELTYAPGQAGDLMVSEVKRVTLDAGSHLNRIESLLSFQGSGSYQVVAGLILHPGGNFFVPRSGSYISEWEPTDDKTAGMIGTALLAGQVTPRIEQISNHAVFLFGSDPKSIQYFAGAGWSKSDVPNQQAWNDYLSQFAARVKSPLKVSWTQE